ncbi:hypothetical protein JHD50_11520 [Sulfurimonas sp. MAG313]|nr:7TM-DISM domain-containing protein [Sulfurimonas sp. MAG313]MDF1881918.1 hypothetical protein [Sulfurimonas sp. MAG313]
MVLRVFIISIVIFLSLSAEYLVELHDSKNVYSVNKGVSYFEDIQARLKVDDIIKDEINFSTLHNNELNFGFTSSVYWLKIKLLNQNKNNRTQWWMDIDYSLLDDIQIYQHIHNQLDLLLHTGNTKIFSRRDIKWRTYSTILDTTESSTVYIRVQTQSAMKIPVKIYSSSHIAKVKQGETLFYGFFLWSTSPCDFL